MDKKELIPLKDYPTDQLREELKKYRDKFNDLVSPPESWSAPRKKDAFNQLMAKMFPAPGKKDSAFEHHLTVIHELWLRGETSY
jgi:hypothetical protein